MTKKEKFDIDNVPRPSPELKKRLAELSKKKYDKTFNKDELKEIEKYSVPKSKTKKILGINFVLILISFIFMAITLVNYFMFNKPFGWFGIVSFLIGVPTFLANIIILIVILFYKRQSIANKVTLTLSKNYIIAEFFTSAKRKTKAVVPLNDDGISFSIGKRDYIVDKEEVWYDFKKRPNSHYVPELPNPLRFNFEKNIKEYFKKLKVVKSNDDPNYVLENDIAFSSTNLQLFKKDKTFADLNKPEGSVDSKTFNMVIIFAGVVIFLLLIGMIVAIVT